MSPEARRTLKPNMLLVAPPWCLNEETPFTASCSTGLCDELWLRDAVLCAGLPFAEDFLGAGWIFLDPWSKSGSVKPLVYFHFLK